MDGTQLEKAEPPHPPPSMPDPSGPATYPSILFELTFKPIFLAHRNTFFLKLEDLPTASFIFSCIFSQIRGTPRKAVGFTSCKVLTKVPCWAQSSVSNTCTPGVHLSSATEGSPGELSLSFLDQGELLTHGSQPVDWPVANQLTRSPWGHSGAYRLVEYFWKAV